MSRQERSGGSVCMQYLHGADFYSQQKSAMPWQCTHSFAVTIWQRSQRYAASTGRSYRRQSGKRPVCWITNSAADSGRMEHHGIKTLY